ncbi:hypothetical protein J2X48_000917 [Bosea sp. BE271]|uniref:hypothetical protein n=1 Tax=Bosea TaxID=85413 RepID=UPI0028580658|nr:MULTISPECIES: hypothetical protein [Bosea]MDR6827199.1 hypothetical protein [Bosea robiniae]MDR6893909.1 hypothetical protein [Bosea sp. BE109]MDR7137304.1 hypothetical protein [Bosea sp. BE168]MDR7174004.1 hypothetical protein [Bosea sp. BE271]
MTITAQLLRTTGPASSAGTQIGSQAIAAPAAWTKLTTLGTIPTGGAILKAASDAEAFRVAVMDPVSTGDTAAADRPPRDNGVLVPTFGAGSQGYSDAVPPGAQVWVKAA